MHHKARKRFGQNFLQDGNIIRQIVQAIAPKVEDNMIEIGPGFGALTKEILPQTKKLTVIEIDRDLIPQLKAYYSDLGELNIIEQDALKVDFSQFYTPTKQKLRIIGNLPYNISTPLLFHLMSFNKLIDDMYFMLQKEVVERITAQVGNKTYGRLSVMVQYFCHAEIIMMVPPAAFNPAPKVDSAIIRLTPYKERPFIAENFEKFSILVRDAFNQRRKTLRNCLKAHLGNNDKVLEQLNIDPKARAENLSVKEFVQLANALNMC